METRRVDFDKLVENLAQDDIYEAVEVERPDREPDFTLTSKETWCVIRVEYWIPERVRYGADGRYTIFDLHTLEKACRKRIEMFGAGSAGQGPMGDREFIKLLDNYRIEQTLLGNDY